MKVSSTQILTRAWAENPQQAGVFPGFCGARPGPNNKIAPGGVVTCWGPPAPTQCFLRRRAASRTFPGSAAGPAPRPNQSGHSTAADPRKTPRRTAPEGQKHRVFFEVSGGFMLKTPCSVERAPPGRCASRPFPWVRRWPGTAPSRADTAQPRTHGKCRDAP